MKVAFFSAHQFDRLFFVSSPTVTFTFIEASLTLHSARLAEGHEAVCVFVNDDLSGEIVAHLHAFGIRLITLRCAGFNRLDREAAQNLGIMVVRVHAYSPESVAEHTIALMLSLSRKIHKAYHRVRDHNFLLDGLLGFTLAGKEVGVVGTGKIGQCLCRILLGFGCKVSAYDPYPHLPLQRLGVRYIDLPLLYAQSDILSLHCPLTADSRHMIDTESIAQMKQGVMIINTGRGALIDTNAALAGLKTEQIGYLGIDVYEEEEELFFHDLSEAVIQDECFLRLLGFPNVLVTSHQAFFTKEALTSIALRTVQSIEQFQESATEVSPEVVVAPLGIKRTGLAA